MNESPEIERRRSERTPTEQKIMLVTTPGAMPRNHEAVMVDVSDHGARVRTNVALKPGQSVELVNTQKGPSASYVMRSQVVWMSKAGGEAGLRFGEPLQMKSMPQAKRAVMR